MPTRPLCVLVLGLSIIACGGNDDAIDPTPINEACDITDQSALCRSNGIAMVGASSDLRRIYWNAPTGAVPASGRHAVVLYQGSVVGPANTWDTTIDIGAPFGGYHQVALVSRLIDLGFTVIQPEARNGVAWTTNTGGNYDTSADGVFVPALLTAIEDGTFGAIDMTQLYATGISSGGYMTSRMAVSYPGTFRALAIQSASYATCLGPICNVPTTLPADHPPTLLLHGATDTTVPISTARRYHTALLDNGIETDFIEAPGIGHAWLDNAPDAISQWFTTH